MKRLNTSAFNQEEISFYLKDVRRCDILSAEQEREQRECLMELKKNNDPELQKQIEANLVKSNLLFVISIAKEYQNSGLDLADIIQEGNIGLLKAFQYFDPTVENKFISYAVYWVRQSIKQALNEKSRTIRIPVNIVSDIAKSKKNTTEFSDLFSEDLSTAYPSCVKLNEELDEEGTTLLDLIANENAPAPDELYERNDDLKERLHHLVGTLEERERTIIEEYFGLYENPRTLEEIGSDMGLTKERVRQLRDKCLSKMKNHALELFPYL
jgi:RNA polymerase primary sigma factor